MRIKSDYTSLDIQDLAGYLRSMAEYVERMTRAGCTATALHVDSAKQDALNRNYGVPEFDHDGPCEVHDR